MSTTNTECAFLDLFSCNVDDFWSDFLNDFSQTENSVVQNESVIQQNEETINASSDCVNANSVSSSCLEVPVEHVQPKPIVSYVNKTETSACLAPTPSKKRRTHWQAWKDKVAEELTKKVEDPNFVKQHKAKHTLKPRPFEKYIFNFQLNKK